jgi:hypothetical protein
MEVGQGLNLGCSTKEKNIPSTQRSGAIEVALVQRDTKFSAFIEYEEPFRCSFLS